MENQRMTELLRELPRERARSGFTARVLARLDEPQAPVRRWPARLAPVALAASLVLVVLAGTVIRDQRREAEALQAVRALRAEHSRIERELRELSAEPPVYYLGGDEDMDLVVDLGKVQPDGGVKPAAVRYDTF
jgi:hypothetical protein